MSGVWESVYAYDIVLRTRALLMARTAAEVSTTTLEGERYRPLDQDRLPNSRDHRVLTTPGYPIEDSTVGTPPLTAALTTRRWSIFATSSWVFSWAMVRRTHGSSRRASPSRIAWRTHSESALTFISTGPTGIMVKRSRSRASQM